MMKIFSFHNKTLKKLNSFSSIKPKATVTAPIFYLNSDPHIGHLYTLLLSDCVSRWLRFNNYDVIFTNGISFIKKYQIFNQFYKEPMNMAKKFKRQPQ